jgi:hypothetical protein
MPNYDAGHYFLTVLAPVSLESVLKDGQSHSRRHLIREALADMPNGERTRASQGKGDDNPFARNTRTHFARFVVLDDVVFNGKVSGDTLLGLIWGLIDKWIWSPIKKLINPLRLTTSSPAPPVDRLSTPFLIFVADFDAASDADGELRQYLAELWTTMSGPLKSVFQHCLGFDKVDGEDDFYRYIKKCQVETTMPFNDYWAAPPSLKDIDLIPYGIGAGIAAVLVLAGLLAGAGWLFLLGLLALALAAYLAYRKVAEAARIPFPKSPPPAPSSDLPTILKALHLQRAFTDFAIAAQGQNDQALYDSFGKFIADHKPDDLAAATQRPGVIGVKTGGAAA